MKKILILLAALAAMLTFAASCSDDKEPEIDIPCEIPYLGFDQIFDGRVIFDSIHQSNAIKLDTTTVNDVFKSELKMMKTDILLPYDENGFDALNPGSQIRFEITYAYYNIGIPGIIKAKIKNVEEVMSTFKCASENDFPITSRAAYDNEVISDKVIRLYYHVIRDVTGFGFNQPEKDMAEIQAYLNQAFKEAKISFEFVGFSYHDYMTPELEEIHNFDNPTFIAGLLSLPRPDDAISVFRMSTTPCDEGINIFGKGMAKEKALFLRLSAKGFTYAHEMGHCLSLVHTHQGTQGRHVSGGDTYSKPELVDGSNSSDAGDFITDTPADPGVWVNGVYKESYTDAKGMYYNPDPTNYMSYSNVGGRFSELQIKKMHQYIRTEIPIVQIKSEISGPQHFASSGTFSYTKIPSKTLQWNITHHWFTTQETEETSTESSSATNLSLKVSRPEYITLQMVDPQTGGVYANFATTAGVPSPVNGTLFWKKSQYGTWEGHTSVVDTENTLVISGNTTIYLGFEHRAGGTVSNLGFRTVTAANRSLSGTTMEITKADCARGFLKFRVSDACGQGTDYFTVPVSVVGGYYAVNVAEGAAITFSGLSGVSPSGRQSAKAKAPEINHIEIFSSFGDIVATYDGLLNTDFTVNTNGWKSGEYKAIVSDGKGYSQEIPFVI